MYDFIKTLKDRRSPVRVLDRAILHGFSDEASTCLPVPCPFQVSLGKEYSVQPSQSSID